MFIPACISWFVFIQVICFNPATGLMFIPAPYLLPDDHGAYRFQSRDWVDVYSGSESRQFPVPLAPCFNPATGLMFIPAGSSKFSSSALYSFQSRDWVDVYSGHNADLADDGTDSRFNPATGLMFIPASLMLLPAEK